MESDDETKNVAKATESLYMCKTVIDNYFLNDTSIVI
jgi:hypothetical protein